MRKVMSALLVATTAVSCTPAESGKAERPKAARSSAAVAVPAVVMYDADKNGNLIGVRTYINPWEERQTGSFAHADVVGALCE